MRLAGQGDRALHGSSERGYAMAALLVGLSVMAVMMSAALPVWTHMVQREKEEELIWRGEQYKRAIGLFQRKYANTFPPTIDLLVEQKFLRKKYKDPITAGDFQIVPVGGQARATGTPGGLGGGFGVPGNQNAQQPGQQQQQSSLSTAAQQQSQVGQQQAALGIQGVVSKSSDTSIKLYNGRSKYSEWQFIFIAMAQRPGGIGAPQPGQQMNPGMMPGQQQMPGMLPGQSGGPGGRGGFAPGGFGPGGTQPGGMQPGGMRPGGFGPGSMQPGGFGQPGQPPNQPIGTQPNTGPFQTPPGGSIFQPVNPVGPQPTRPVVPGGFGTPVRPPGK